MILVIAGAPEATIHAADDYAGAACRISPVNECNGDFSSVTVALAQILAESILGGA